MFKQVIPTCVANVPSNSGIKPLKERLDNHCESVKIYCPIFIKLKNNENR